VNDGDPSPRGLLPLLAFTGALGSFGIHMFVPAMPAAAHDLQALPSTLQLAISLYLAGLCAGQLIAGPAADQFGRRPVLVTGAALYTLGALGAAAALFPGQLLVARVVQSLGGAAALLSARALIADAGPPEHAARRLAGLMSIMLISPMLAPAVGGVVVSLGNWRSIFWTLATLGCIGLLISTLLLPASQPRSASVGTTGVLTGYKRLVADTDYLRTVLASASISASLFIYMNASAFLLISLYHLTPAQSGISYLLVASASFGGTLVVRASKRPALMLRIGLALGIVGSLAFTIAAWAGHDGPATLVGAMSLISCGAGLTAPVTMARAMQCHPAFAATASSLAAAAQLLVSAGSTALLAAFHFQSPIATGVALSLATGAACLLMPKRAPCLSGGA
jgi:MFS transporter, DHA1 family, multidrug resistance protein